MSQIFQRLKYPSALFKGELRRHGLACWSQRCGFSKLLRCRPSSRRGGFQVKSGKSKIERNKWGLPERWRHGMRPFVTGMTSLPSDNNWSFWYTSPPAPRPLLSTHCLPLHGSTTITGHKQILTLSFLHYLFIFNANLLVSSWWCFHRVFVLNSNSFYARAKRI